MEGMKNDKEKLRWDLLPISEVEEVVSVLTHGAKKYADNNWQVVVKDNPDRYFAACMRHIVAYREGEREDPDSGLLHLAHAICCLLFIMWRDKEIE
jgi:hypothetical protein